MIGVKGNGYIPNINLNPKKYNKKTKAMLSINQEKDNSNNK